MIYLALSLPPTGEVPFLETVTPGKPGHRDASHRHDHQETGFFLGCCVNNK